MKFMSKPASRGILTTVLFVLLLNGSVRGQESDSDPADAAGKTFFISVSTPASGRWAQKYPFNPVTYGKSNGHCPLNSEGSKIVLCTLSLDRNFLRLAAAVDALVGRHKGLEWSLIQVADSKRAQFTGYTTLEIEKRIAELRKIARQNKIEHLSFTISAPNAFLFSSLVGFTDSHNLLIAHLTAEDASKPDVRIRWSKQTNTANLSGKTIQEIVTSLEKSVIDKP